MFFSKCSDRAICATWFGGVALILTLPFPFHVALFWWHEQKFDVNSAFAVYLVAVIPTASAAFFGSRLGIRIFSQESTLSNFESFVIGMKISIAAAIAWIVVGVLSITACSSFFDTSGMSGSISFMAFFGFPVYGLLAGLGGLGLRRLVIRRGITRDGRGQKASK